MVLFSSSFVLLMLCLRGLAVVFGRVLRCYISVVDNLRWFDLFVILLFVCA